MENITKQMVFPEFYRKVIVLYFDVENKHSYFSCLVLNSHFVCYKRLNLNFFYYFFFQADSLKKSLKSGSGSLDTKLQQVKELEDEVCNKNKNE